jgi:protein-arginine kinase
MWIFERRFPNDYGRCEYRKINAVTENKNENIEIIINDADKIRQQILAKFGRVEESNELLIS